ncbi:MAG: tRNA (adenosine(37)-N6)-threonylcarbamoyltransferase complex dimerization subunit type 1 TsaB [bacterium]
MKILAVETATNVCGVALSDDNHLIAEYRLNHKNVHNEKLVSAIQCLTKDAKWGLEELNGIAVSIGPGSFTGLRIGITVCKGLAYILEIPLVAVNTLDALAYQAHLWSGHICSVIKAREGEVYFALYKKSPEMFRRCSDYQIILTKELSDFIKERTLIVSIPYKGLSTLTNNKVELAPPETSMIAPFTIAQLGYIKFQKKELEDLESLEPFYLKEFAPERKVYYGV